jgi:cell wall-associated NlpC family hydrolase
VAGLLIFGLAMTAAGLVGGGSLMFSAGAGCAGGTATGGGGTGTDAAVQPPASPAGKNSIPANYLQLFQREGRTSGVPWGLLAGIGKVESDFGRTTLPGVRSGANAFGAAGPMQIGIGGASGNTWGGAPVHPASEPVNGVATDANGDGVASVYDPADAIAGAAKYLLQHGVLTNAAAAIFAYNHLASYVQAVLSWAALYSRGGFTVTASSPGQRAQCLGTTASTRPPNRAAAAAIAFARQQIGKPYLWGGTGPDAFDCSGLVMMAYRAGGVLIPRTSEQQWLWGPRVAPGQEQPGDLVFFAGSDGTPASPGHVGLVIGHNLMVEAYATGFPIRVAQFGTSAAAPGDQQPVGFTRPWQHSGISLAAAHTGRRNAGQPAAAWRVSGPAVSGSPVPQAWSAVQMPASRRSPSARRSRSASEKALSRHPPGCDPECSIDGARGEAHHLITVQ